MENLSKAKQEIAIASADAVKAIAVAAEAAGKVISTAAHEASQVVVNNATQTAKQLTVRGSDDHDRLVVLDTKMDGLSDQIKELKNTNAKRIDALETEKLNCRDSYPVLYKKEVDDRLENHEIRIKSGEITDTRLIAYGTALIFIIGIVEFIINKYF
jgi:nicotinic acid phosphoribosyltransferase